VSIGRYATSTAYRSYAAYSSSLTFSIRFIKSLIKCSLYCDIAKKLVHKVDSVYLDHACYENGVFYDVMSIHKIPIYHNHYPYSLIKYIPKCAGSFEDSLFIPNKKISDEDILEGRNLMLQVMDNPTLIPYMLSEQTKYGDENQYDYVIYSHSFTDAQLYYGYDYAFNNVMEWLEYTVNILKDKKICIKAHPEIFTKGYVSDVTSWDRKLFFEFSSKYGDQDNIDIIDSPVSNVDFLNNINRSAILVTHHGNAILEGGFMGFKCICSSKSNWKNFDIFNTWSTQEEYKKLLCSNFESLRSANLNEMNKYNYLLRSLPQSYLSSSWWVNLICKITKKESSEIIKDPYCLETLDSNLKSQCIKEISESLITL
jgi:hypothetical protein